MLTKTNKINKEIIRKIAKTQKFFGTNKFVIQENRNENNEIYITENKEDKCWLKYGVSILKQNVKTEKPNIKRK